MAPEFVRETLLHIDPHTLTGETSIIHSHQWTSHADKI